MVSNARDDFPDPDKPVITMSLSRGSSRSMPLRLCVRAPRMVIFSNTFNTSSDECVSNKIDNALPRESGICR